MAAISPIRPDRPAARTFRDLVVWRKAHELALAIYSFTAHFPKSETYGLASQIRRSAVSVPANIAEGFRRRGRADKARFMNIAEGSLEETRYCLLLAHDLGYGDGAQLTISLEEVSRLCSTDTPGDTVATPDSWLLTPCSKS